MSPVSQGLETAGPLISIFSRSRDCGVSCFYFLKARRLPRLLFLVSQGPETAASPVSSFSRSGDCRVSFFLFLKVWRLPRLLSLFSQGPETTASPVSSFLSLSCLARAISPIRPVKNKANCTVHSAVYGAWRSAWRMAQCTWRIFSAAILAG